MDEKSFAIALLSLVVIACLIQALYPEKLGRIVVRRIAASPRPIREFYAWASFGKPYDGPFWNEARRVIAIVVGVMFSAAIVALIRG
jgi:hypothetical protein